MEEPAASSLEDTNVRVAVRCRPFSTKEKGNNEVSCVKISPDRVILTNPGGGGEDHSFAFDLVYDDNSTQQAVWQHVGTPILEKALAGYNGTIFAYGQTGSGKTWSMQGADGDNQGIIPRMNNSLFDRIESEKGKMTTQFLVTVSYFEIYNEVIFDLLDPMDRKKRATINKGGLEIKEHPLLGVYVKGLQEIVVDSAPKLQMIIDQGMGNRTVASTQMNADSSRSHSVFMITIHQKDLSDPTKNIFAKISLVDLAGSERVKSTGATGAILKEGANINKSLSALGNVINALVESGKGKGTFIPYRNSKLTRVLQDSLGGNSITAMLAALSPAASNFEETLSTLKYANRAKAIKVKAVKNEEASQVSKLNDEIRVLRDLLENQQHNVDVSVMEEKQRQHLKDLEEAMKSTWEEKAKQSEEFERNRLQLLEEQRSTTKQFEASRERNWKLLEDKNDLEISISHVKELSQRYTKVSSAMKEWGVHLRDIVKLERALAEQDTIVQVYRTAVHKDSRDLIKKTSPHRQGDVVSSTSFAVQAVGVSGTIGSATLWDSSTASVLKQLRDKFSAMTLEVSKWSSLQDELTQRLYAFYQIVSESTISSGDFSGMEGDEGNEIGRGLKLITLQLEIKNDNITSLVSASRSAIADFGSISSDWIALLRQYSEVVQHQQTQHVSDDALAKQLLLEINQCVDDLLLDISMTTSKVNLPPYTSAAAVASSNANSMKETVPLTSFTVVDCAQAPLLNGKHSWQGRLSSGSSGLVAQWAQPATVCSVTIQGGVALVDGAAVVTTTGDGSNQAMMSSSGVLPRLSRGEENGGGSDSSEDGNAHLITLPCGLTLAKCAGNVEMTAEALADIFDWVDVVKKNPPEKFLKRPPVRFIFDLVKHLCVIIPGFFPDKIAGVSWETVGETKQSKLDFNEELINFVASNLSVPPVATASAIVTGSDPELTNIMLQQLALAAYRYNSIPQQAETIRKSKSMPAGVGVTQLSTWVTSFRLCTSLDGASWTEHNAVTSTGLKSVSDTFVYQLAAPTECKFLKVMPLSCDSADRSLVANGDYCALRIQILSEKLVPPKRIPSSVVTSSILKTDLLFTSLKQHEFALEKLISASEFLWKQEECRRAESQLLVQKNLESLGKEKQALEKRLADEKQASNNDKQDLADQLKQCFSQLKETDALLEREQGMNQQLQINQKQTEQLNISLQLQLSEKENENASLKGDILRLQAMYEKHKSLIENIQANLSEREQQCDSLQNQVVDYEQRQEALQHEKDELCSQVAVLTEERDAARTHEEELFEQLGERTNDLERLQESYVDICDKFHDAQDEACELRDQLDNAVKGMKAAMAASSSSSSSSVASTAQTRHTVSPAGTVSLHAAAKVEGSSQPHSQGSSSSAKASKKEKADSQSSSSSSSSGGMAASHKLSALPAVASTLPSENNGSRDSYALSAQHEVASAKPPPPAAVAKQLSGTGYHEDFDEYEDEFENAE